MIALLIILGLAILDWSYWEQLKKNLGSLFK